MSAERDPWVAEQLGQDLTDPDQQDEPDGSRLLHRVEAFLCRFVAYPSEPARIAHALWIAHAHLMDAWESTPRIAFLSPEPGSGKSRALEVTELLVPRPVHAVNATPAFLFRKVSDPEGPPTLLYDEIDTLFGPKAKDNEDVRGMLNAGHRRGAVAGRCVTRGKNIETEELPAYCAVALAGLDDLPDTIATRSIIVRMRRRAPSEVVEPFRHRVHSPSGHDLRDCLAEWAREVSDTIDDAWPDMPDGIEDRNADVWEALLAVADAAGGPWPERARTAAVTLVTDVTDSQGRRGSLGVRLLADLRDVFAQAGTDRLPTVAILDRLHDLDESPWADLRGKPLDARGLSHRLGRYGVKRRTVRIGDDIVKGYEAADLHDAWVRYLPDVTAVTDVTDGNGATPATRPSDGPDVTAQSRTDPYIDLPLNDHGNGAGTRSHGRPAESVTSVTTVTPHPAPTVRARIGVPPPPEVAGGTAVNAETPAPTPLALLRDCSGCGRQTVTDPCRDCGDTNPTMKETTHE